MTWYGLRGAVSNELISYRGRVLVHDNPEEASWVLCRSVTPIRLSARFVLVNPVMRLRDHPHLAHMSWPLDRAAFRGGS